MNKYICLPCMRLNRRVKGHKSGNCPFAEQPTLSYNKSLIKGKELAEIKELEASDLQKTEIEAIKNYLMSQEEMDLKLLERVSRSPELTTKDAKWILENTSDFVIEENLFKFQNEKYGGKFTTNHYVQILKEIKQIPEKAFIFGVFTDLVDKQKDNFEKSLIKSKRELQNINDVLLFANEFQNQQTL